MSNSNGASLSKTVALIGLGAAVFIAVTWILPKFERHHPGVVVSHSHPHPHPGLVIANARAHETPATSPIAHRYGMSGHRDYNLAGLGIEEGANGLGTVSIADI